MKHVNIRVLFVGFALTAALCGCKQQGPHENANPASMGTEASSSTEPNPEARATDDAPVGKLFELALASTSNEPLLLATGQAISGELQPTYTGKVMGLAIQVGTFGDSSQGTLTAQVCDDAGKCEKGSIDLSAAKDNEYLVIPLDAGVQLVAGQVSRYTVTRAGGENKFAVWTYPGETGMTLPAGGHVPRVPKLGLQY